MRADSYLVLHGYAASRELAKKMIFDGRVFINGRAVVKASNNVEETDEINILKSESYEYVSRGGYKLEAAIKSFGVNVDGFVAADLGASSGGFCDCLLHHGASKVYAVDCGSGQLAAKLKDDSRIISIENTNARFIDDSLFGEKTDIVVMDLSFISQTLVFPAVSRILKPSGIFISLIKPQFEVGRAGIGKNGIVKNEKLRILSVKRVTENAELFGFKLRDNGIIESPIKGGDGNIEYLAVFDFVGIKKT